MKTIFQTGFRPANPFEARFNAFASPRLGQEGDFGWEPTVMPTEEPTYTSQVTPSEMDEWESLQQSSRTTTPTSTTTPPKKGELSPLEQIAKGIVAGGAEAATAYAKAEQDKAKAAGLTTKPGMVHTLTPGATGVGGSTNTTLLVGIGAAALVAIIAVAVA
jgi:cytoskeletal protein RodZ